MKIDKKGISLIVLVITIIVMIIIASAVILTLTGNGIIGRANEATNNTNTSNISEVVAVTKSEWMIMSKKNKAKYARGYSEYAEAKLEEAGYEIGSNGGQYQIGNDGTIYEYKIPVIPSGFVASDLEDEDEVSEGLVIYEGTDKVSTDTDAKNTRNQFVWVPVPNISEFVRINWTNSSVFLSNYSEPLLYKGTTSKSETENYNKMKASIEKYGGFYIARYEAGKEKINGIETAVSKKEVASWRQIEWGAGMMSTTKGATYYSKKMYEDKTDITSTLVYGVEWDATLKFISKTMPEYPTSIVDTKSNPDLKTGLDLKDANGKIINKANNIYDMAGLTREWTMEACYSSMRVTRGGSFDETLKSPSYRDDDSPSAGFTGNGFRVALYIN